jgi:DNA-binding HxlR family transcriptional regulator
MNVTRGPIDWQSSDLVRALGVIGGKWKVQIICHLLDGTKRFSQLRRMLPGISRGVLSYELRQLQHDGIVERTQYQTIPPTVEYFLTAKGRAVKPVLSALRRWTREYGA